MWLARVHVSSPDEAVSGRLDEERATLDRTAPDGNEGIRLASRHRDLRATLEREDAHPTKRGGQRWYPVTVSRVVRRAKDAESSMSASATT